MKTDGSNQLRAPLPPSPFVAIAPHSIQERHGGADSRCVPSCSASISSHSSSASSSLSSSYDLYTTSKPSASNNKNYDNCHHHDDDDDRMMWLFSPTNDDVVRKGRMLPPWTLSLFAGATSGGIQKKINAATASSSSEGLSNIPQAKLKESIEPILDELRSINAEELLFLERVQHPPATGGEGAIVDVGVYVHPIHDLVQPPTTIAQGNIVRCIHLNEVSDQYSMGIFIFPPHAKIPLHDHPGMCVLSRILYGDVQRLSLDLPSSTMTTEGVTSSNRIARDKISSSQTTLSWPKWGYSSTSTTVAVPAPSSRMEFDDSISSTVEIQKAQQNQHQATPLPRSKLAYKTKDVETLQAPAVTCLFPYEGNLHEFVAGPNGAAILDVLLPPYDADHERDCTFYEIVVVDGGTEPVRPDDQEFFLSPTSATSVATKVGYVSSNQAENDYSNMSSCWIVPTGQPEDFHCISGRYRGLGSNG